MAALLPLTARAEVVKDLYAATLPAPDHSEQARQKALHEGLEQVLVKLTGDSDIAARDGVADFLDRAESHVTEFGYVNLPEAVAEEEQTDIGISVRYSEPDIDAFLRRRELPIWPANRPALLVWLVVEPSDGEQRFLQREDKPALWARLEWLMKGRGQPVRFPLHDLQDQFALDVGEAWSLNADAIREASARYSTDTWLLIRGYQTSGGDWRGAWLVEVEGNTHLRDGRGETLEAIVARAVHSAVDRVAAEYTYVANTAPGEVELMVAGVSSGDDYTELTQMLRSVSMVRRLDVVQVDGEELLLRLDVEGERHQLLETLTLNNRLSAPESTVGGRLYLQWRGGG